MFRRDAVGSSSAGDVAVAVAALLRHGLAASRTARVDEEPAFARPCGRRCMTDATRGQVSWS